MQWVAGFIVLVGIAVALSPALGALLVAYTWTAGPSGVCDRRDVAVDEGRFLNCEGSEGE
jgi:hypothetical protein